MGAAHAASFLPYLLISPLSGIIADSRARKPLLASAYLSLALLMAAIGIYLKIGGESMSVLLILLFLLGSIETLIHSSVHGLTPSMADKAALPRLNSWIFGLDSSLQVVGPTLGGLAIAIIGLDRILLIAPVFIGLSALFIWAMRLVTPEDPSGKTLCFSTIAPDMRQGWRIIMAQPVIKWGAFLFIIVNFALQLIVGNAMFLLTQVMTLSADQAGFALGMAATGSLIGAFIASRLFKRYIAGRIMIAGVAVALAGNMVLFLIPDLGEVASSQAA